MEKYMTSDHKNYSSNYEIVTDLAGDLTADLQNAYHIRVAHFDQAAEDARANDRDILFIGSAAASVSADTNGRILCVDAQPETPGLDVLVLKLSRLRAAGATLEEAAAYFEHHLADAATFASRLVCPIWSPEAVCG